MAFEVSELSVFLPAFNEEKTIKDVVLKTKAVLEGVAAKWEIIVVNDGSNDSTVEIVQGLVEKDKRIRLINHDKNRGYGASLRSGLYESKYEWISFIDSDGQFDFSEITSFIARQKETNADIVIGYYKKRQVSRFTVLTSKIWELVVFVLFGLNVRDIDCGFKLISKKVVDSIPKLESEKGAFISSELLVKARNKGFKIVEIPVNHYPRAGGVATGRKLSVIIKSFVDLFRLWIKLH